MPNNDNKYMKNQFNPLVWGLLTLTSITDLQLINLLMLLHHRTNKYKPQNHLNQGNNV